MSFTYKTSPFSYLQDFSAASPGNLVAQLGFVGNSTLSANSPIVSAGKTVQSPAASDGAAVLSGPFLGLDIAQVTDYIFKIKKVGGLNQTDQIAAFIFGDPGGIGYYFLATIDAGFDQSVSADHFVLKFTDQSDAWKGDVVVAGSWAVEHTVMFRELGNSGEQTEIWFDGVKVLGPLTGEWLNITANYPQLYLTAGAAAGIELTAFGAAGTYIQLDTLTGAVSGADVVLTFAYSDGVTFEISRDGGAFTARTSPHTFAGDALGPHTYTVRAKDASGNVLAQGIADAASARHLPLNLSLSL